MTYSTTQGLNGAVYALHSDHEGVIWVATRDTVLRLVDGRLTPIKMPLGTRFTRLASLSSDSKGNLWIADFYQGVFRWSNGQLTKFPDTTKDGQVSQLVYVDASDRVWIGLAPGALGEVKDDGTLRLYRREQGITGFVTALHEDGAGRLWIATDNS
ncbi:MAG: hypothetical protein DMF90_27465, partial [Acidobacteria bacterium]